MDQIPLPYETLFLVCTNQRSDGRRSCGPDGGDSLRDLLKRLVGERVAARRFAEGDAPKAARRARVAASGCLGCCEDGPTVVVFPGATRYAHVREEDLPAILDRHLPPEV